jgi:hypothetical protein
MPALRLQTFVSDDERAAPILLRAASTLVRLDISGMKRVCSAVVARLAREKQPALPELVVLRCARCGSDGAVSVLRLTEMCPKLEGLDVGFCTLRVPVTIDDLAYTLQSCPFLVHLDIQMVRLASPRALPTERPLSYASFHDRASRHIHAGRSFQWCGR